MRIAVLQPPAGQEVSGLDQLVHHRAVGRAEPAGLLALGLQHLQPAEQRDVLVIGAVLVDRLGDLPMPVRQPEQIIVLAVSGRGVDKACAGLVGDVVALEQGNGELIAAIEIGQRVGADHATGIDRLDPVPIGDFCRDANLLGQLVGDDQPVAGPGPGREG